MKSIRNIGKDTCSQLALDSFSGLLMTREKDKLRKGGTDMATVPEEVSGSLQSLYITLNKPLKIMLLLFEGIITTEHQKTSNRPLMKSQREYI